MRFAVYGSGGVGGYFGGRLAEAGHDVVFIARGPHLEAIRRQGLRIESVAGDALVQPARATDDPASVGVVDAVIVAVKAWQVPEAARAIRPMVGPDTVVLPLQNGVEAPGQLAAVLGEEAVLPGLCKIMTLLAAPGVIRHPGVPPRIEFGERDGRTSPRVEALRRAFEGARGVSVGTPADIEAARWEKFLFIAPLSGVGAVTRVPAGPLRRVPESRDLLRRAMTEVFDLARARKVALREDAVSRTLGFVDGMPEEATSSMQRDIMEGRPSELESQNGTVVRLGREAGVDTPVNAFVYASLLPSEKRARGDL